MRINDLHAVFANVRTHGGDRFTFRVGKPTDWRTAQARWYRLDDRRGGFNRTAARAVRILWGGTAYTVESFEVRAIHPEGYGLGQERHSLALPVPYRAVRSALR